MLVEVLQQQPQAIEYGKETWKTGKERWGSSSFFVMRNVQLYDENFFNSIEDWDFWMRMRLEKKMKTAYTNKACYQHYDSFSRFRRPELDLEDQKNRDYFVSKWGMQPEELFEKHYPEQLAKPWKPFP